MTPRPPLAAVPDEKKSAPPISTPAVLTPVDVLKRWRAEGPLVRMPTGIAPLDKLSRGGLPFPWRVLLVGAPSAGKTFLETVIADAMARSLVDTGISVGILGVDEEPDDLVVRLAQIAGYTIEEIEQRDPTTLSEIVQALEPLPIRLYDASHTIESAAADLAQMAEAKKSRAALFVDSIQTARSEAGIAVGADTSRAIVEANIAAVRFVATKYRMLVAVTSEANRNSYRTQQAADESNDLAAGAESRTIEYGAQTMLMLRTPKDHPNVIWCRVTKNRRANHGEFFLRIDREQHTLTPCADPSPPEGNEDRNERKRAAKVADVERDARALIEILSERPGIGERDLRSAAKAAGIGGRERVDAASALLRRLQGFAGYHMVDRGSGAPGLPREWHLEQLAVADE